MRTNNSQASNMMKNIRLLLSTVLTATAMVSMSACVDAGPDISQVQTNVVSKDIFEGEWWFTQTMIDVDAAEARFGAFEGAMNWGDAGYDTGALTMARVRWVIDEDFLFAFRTYELIDGGNDDGRDRDFRGQPIAAFMIESHLDVNKSFSGWTGQETNVTIENTTDRRWYEREFMRVDWSANHIQSFYSTIEGAPVSTFFQENAQEEFPKSWQPQFIRASEDPNYRFADEWPSDQADKVHFMSFVTQNIIDGGNCFVNGSPCQSGVVHMRNAFLRVPPNHQYAVEVQTHGEFDRFGTFRAAQRTYVRGGGEESSLRRFCTTNEDCGTNACDVENNICVGGLTEDYGETDLLNFYRPRHNTFKQHLTNVACRADWECDRRNPLNQQAIASDPSNADFIDGSVCDRAARMCTLPIKQREIREVAYHLNPGFPKHLVRSSFEVMGNWNEAFMRGWRGVQGRAYPQANSARMACQSADPTRFCYCAADGGVKGPEVAGDNTCGYKYDPFQPPAEAAAAGVADPFNCFVEGPAAIQNPTSFDQYTLPEAFQYRFTHDPALGESECILVLKSNTCDLNRTDENQTCDEVFEQSGEDWERLGDIRYQFYNLVPHGNVFFGGVSIPLMDPTTGELITANANMSGEAAEGHVAIATMFFPALRGEPGAEDSYLSGENVREYFARLGNVQHPVLLANNGSDGFSIDDPSRPGLPLPLADGFEERMSQAMPRVEQLHGQEGRSLIHSDRKRLLAGTAVERNLMASIQDELVTRRLDTTKLPNNFDPMSDAAMDRLSPFRSMNDAQAMNEEETFWFEMGKHHIDPPMAEIYRSRYWEYWANAFAGRPLGEASIRMQQAYVRAVMHHEMGHSVGMRHNFAATFDRNQYFDGYFQKVLGNPDDSSDDLALPTFDEFDSAERGGDQNGYVGGAEIEAYLEELRRVRNERANSGVGNTTASSTMDYAGDLSDYGGLGHYDRAHLAWNHFNQVEAYVGDPRNNSTNSLNGVNLSHTTQRESWTYYRGGESCSVDSDCPYAPGSAALGDQAIAQRCIRNTRFERLSTPCAAGEEACICTNFDNDFIDYTDNVGYNSDANGDGQLDHFPVNYLFCSDERAFDISWCSRFDAGESFLETVDHFRRTWEERYPMDYFRRFRATGPRPAGSLNGIITGAKIFQHLFFRYFNELGFRSETGPLGFQDQYLASIDAMHWFTEIVTKPDVGSYRMNDDRGVYERMGDELNMAGSDFSLDTGEGFHMWTAYQEGYRGFFRNERAGVFLDKIYAMLGLSNRFWGFNFTVDELYYINFYDLFPIEMTDFFGSLMIDDPKLYAPRVTMEGGEPQVQMLNWFRTGGAACDPVCRPNNEATYTDPPIDGTMNLNLRHFALIQALAEFPVFYDTTFEQRVNIFKEGNGAGWSFPDTQPDGRPTCAYNPSADADAASVTINENHVDSNDPTCGGNEDYIVYNSERLNTRYVAAVVRSRLVQDNLAEEQIGYEILKQAVDLQEEMKALGWPNAVAPANAERVREMSRRLQERESDLEYTIQISQIMGISESF